jgi:hypothetical protein
MIKVRNLIVPIYIEKTELSPPFDVDAHYDEMILDFRSDHPENPASRLTGLEQFSAKLRYISAWRSSLGIAQNHTESIFTALRQDMCA